MVKYALVLLCLIGAASAIMAQEGPRSLQCRSAGTFKRYVFVQTNKELQDAAANVRAGDMIELRARNYTTPVTINKSGTAKNPIIMCGPAAAKIQGGFQGPAVTLKKSNFVILSGLTISRANMGVMVDGSTPVELRNLNILRIANQGIYLRNSPGAIVSGVQIVRVGIRENNKGQGIYIDKSRNVQVINNNIIGRIVPAEMIYVTAGSDGGLISNNAFQGQDISGRSGADSWVDLRANGFQVSNNTGFATPKDGFRVSGRNNIFSNNRCFLSWNSAGVCINVDCDAACQSTNTIECSNSVTPGANSGNAKELTNIKISC